MIFIQSRKKNSDSKNIFREYEGLCINKLNGDEDENIFSENED